MEQMTYRDFSSVSPSAKGLLLMKRYTNIPFAKEMAELMEYPDKYIPDFEKGDSTFWGVTTHVENRYWSINQLLNDLTIRNILELSSGFSFRSLEYVKHGGVHYIDTDLPDVIADKNKLINSLKIDRSITKGKLELIALNALDKNRFHEIAGRFSQGEVVIVNEGLLVYLNRQEKEKLCSIIHDILMERGGYWITADIYLKNDHFNLDNKLHREVKEFTDHHNVKDNSFESFEEAEAFFKSMGFIIDKKAEINYSKMSSYKHLIKNLTEKQLTKLGKVGKMQATWRLKAI